MNNHPRHHGGAEDPTVRRDWRRLHHSRLFWVGLFMMLLAITIYVHPTIWPGGPGFNGEGQPSNRGRVGSQTKDMRVFGPDAGFARSPPSRAGSKESGSRSERESHRILSSE